MIITWLTTDRLSHSHVKKVPPMPITSRAEFPHDRFRNGSHDIRSTVRAYKSVFNHFEDIYSKTHAVYLLL